MKDPAKTEADRQQGISRRDFFLGRILRKFRHGNTAVKSDRAAERPSLLRYPKSREEVAAGQPAKTQYNHSDRDPLSAASARRRTIPVLRPPGAIEEQRFLEGCTRCELCIEACPHDAIIHAPARLREAAGTPMIDADRQPCLMCADFPCITACEPDVLTFRLPVAMGTAKVTEHLCVAHHGTTCTVCSERCPVDSAISLADGKPSVSESVCTGCGVCRYVCPAPENAILLMPTFRRPTPTQRGSHE